jgi:hypothetical protein
MDRANIRAYALHAAILPILQSQMGQPSLKFLPILRNQMGQPLLKFLPILRSQMGRWQPAGLTEG